MTEDLAAMTDEDIPSRRLPLLAAIRDASIARLTRYSWTPKHAIAADHGLGPELAFSRTAGPLLITLSSGLVIAAASQPALISVTLWLDVDPGAAADPELYPIEADDPEYGQPGFARMLGKRAIDVAILTRDPEREAWRDRPREAGVVIAFDGAPELILAHGLHDDSDDFSVLLREDVDAALWPRLHAARIA
jgi:hypothetical protein